MAKEYKYRCKNCNNEILIAERVFRLMMKRGESLPERCEECRKKHDKEIRAIKSPYFQAELVGNYSVFDFYQSLYTSHGNRQRREEEVTLDTREMKIRITDDLIKKFYEILDKTQVVILASPTGTGKSVRVFYRLLEAADESSKPFVERLLHQGQLIQTQPMSEAASRIPQTIAQWELKESGVGPGQTMGFRHRGKEEYDRHNLGVVVTDGSLRNWGRDGHLGQYSLIMIDEAHKRTLNIDTLLLFLKHRLPIYPHLRVIIASATINLKEFKETFEQEGISVEVFDLSKVLGEEVSYKVHYWGSEAIQDCDCWWCRSKAKGRAFSQGNIDNLSETQLSNVTARVILEILGNTEEGSILAFLPGEGIIERTKALIEEGKREIDPGDEVPIISIYSRVGEEEVKNRFAQMGNKRRVLLTTDIAETSHTLEDLVYVIDSGYIKESQWDPQLELSTLPVVRHSQAGCFQRYGRVGRTQKGYVYCLYTEVQFKTEFKQQSSPEVFKSPLEDVLLTLKAAGISKEFSSIGKPENEDALEKQRLEIKRASKSVQAIGLIDARNNITDKGLEFFRTPFSATDKALFDAADEQNCLVEMVTAVLMMKTTEGVPRTGAELYHPLNGLLIWDSRWTARTKKDVWRIHQALRVGCRDDLDFVAKLAFCFIKAEKKGLGNAWAEWYFANGRLLRGIIRERDKIIHDHYRIKVSREETRDIEMGLLDRVRSVMATVLPERIVKLKHSKTTTYIIEVEGKTTSGSISEYCAGDWSEENEAIVVAVTKRTSIVDGKAQWVPVASFMVRLPSQPSGTKEAVLFADQQFPVGSLVGVHKQNDSYSVARIVRFPLPVSVDYKVRMTIGMLLEDFLRSDYSPTVYFKEELSEIRFGPSLSQVSANWLDGISGNGEEVKIVGWDTASDPPVAIVVPQSDLALLVKLRSEKRIGDKLKVLIERVVRDSDGRRGWVIGRTGEGLEIPMEFTDLSLSPFGFGLELIESKEVDLRIISFDLMGHPRLSNIGNLIEDIEKIRSESIHKEWIRLEGIVREIDVVRKRIVVSCLREAVLAHSFDVNVSERLLQTLKTNDKVTVKLSPSKEEASILYELSEHGREFMPKRLRYDPETGRVYFPYCLRQEELEQWEAPSEVVENIFKNSWRYCLRATIDVSKQKPTLNEGDIFKGKVVRPATYSKGPMAGKISGLEVEIEMSGGTAVGFVPFSKLKRSWNKQSKTWLVPQVGDVIQLQVLSLEEGRLTFSQISSQ